MEVEVSREGRGSGECDGEEGWRKGWRGAERGGAVVWEGCGEGLGKSGMATEAESGLPGEVGRWGGHLSRGGSG